MLTNLEAQKKLLSLLQTKSVSYGDFVLSSGAKSKYYVDCKLTTLDPEGGCLVGQVMYSLIQKQALALGVTIHSVGGLTMGADPIAFAVGMYSFWTHQAAVLKPFIVRKTPKTHGKAQRIEGNFKPGELVVVLDDVITRGEKIEDLGYTVVSALDRDQLIRADAKPRQPADCVAA